MLFDINERLAPQKLRTFVKFNGQQIKVYLPSWITFKCRWLTFRSLKMCGNDLSSYHPHTDKTLTDQKPIGCLNFRCTDCVWYCWKSLDQTHLELSTKAIYLASFVSYQITIKTQIHSNSWIRHCFKLSYWWLPDWKTMFSQPCDFWIDL